MQTLRRSTGARGTFEVEIKTLSPGPASPPYAGGTLGGKMPLGSGLIERELLKALQVHNITSTVLYREYTSLHD
jgi:hypothetical protein